MKFFTKIVGTTLLIGLIAQVVPVRADWKSFFPNSWTTQPSSTASSKTFSLVNAIAAAGFIGISGFFIGRFLSNIYFPRESALERAQAREQMQARELAYGANPVISVFLNELLWSDELKYGLRNLSGVLSEASARGDTRAVQELLKFISDKKCLPQGIGVKPGLSEAPRRGSPLITALKRGNFATAKVLLDAGYTSDNGAGILHRNASDQCRKSAARLLQNIQAGKSSHDIILQVSCLNRSVTTMLPRVGGLLEQGVNINVNVAVDEKIKKLLILCGQISVTDEEFTNALQDEPLKGQALKVMRARIERKGKDSTLDEARLLARLGDSSVLESIQKDAFINTDRGKALADELTDLVLEKLKKMHTGGASFPKSTREKAEALKKEQEGKTQGEK